MTKFEVGKTYLHTLDTGAGMRFRIDARTEKMATVTIHPGGGRYEKTRRRRIYDCGCIEYIKIMDTIIVDSDTPEAKED